jgi:hypothetical protein
MMRISEFPRLSAPLILLGALASLPVAAEPFELALRERVGPALEAVPPLPPPGQFPVQLVLDDDAFEGAIGVAGAAARQFMWFNSFASPGEFVMEEVWVLFPDNITGQGIPVGGAVEIVIFHDPDSNPINGALRIDQFSATIQANDGNTFSVFSLPVPLNVPAGGDVLVGVINRYVQSGVTPPTLPAAVDTTATAARSWIAVWSGDPPGLPTLPTDGTTQLLDAFLPSLAGNWMIRAFGIQQPTIEVPTVDPIGLTVLATILLLCALALLRRSRRLPQAAKNRDLR